MQAKASHLSALFGGRMPMTMTSPPGGSTHVPTVDDIANYLFRIKELQNWIDNVYVPDVLAIAPYYLDYAGVGKGHANFLSWGVFEDASLIRRRGSCREEPYLPTVFLRCRMQNQRMWQSIHLTAGTRALSP